MGLIEPMSSSAGGSSPALHIDWRKSSDDRPACLENPRLKGGLLTNGERRVSIFRLIRDKLTGVSALARRPARGEDPRGRGHYWDQASVRVGIRNARADARPVLHRNPLGAVDPEHSVG